MVFYDSTEGFDRTGITILQQQVVSPLISIYFLSIQFPMCWVLFLFGHQLEVTLNPVLLGAKGLLCDARNSLDHAIFAAVF